jgi:hypothetical protein
MPGWLTLMGSGETAAGMVKVHRRLLAALPEPPHPVFLETPAGFELGLAAIASRFGEFFERRLGLSVALAPYHGAGDDPHLVADALAAVSKANYILAGPGSPTYAARQWSGSPVFAAVIERWLGGAQLVFASAAAIALSRHALPVYEIYKVGQELHWSEGLDLLGRFGLDLAIITHWDNAEGGTHDTRACFMGMERLERLRQLLPSSTVVLGVDEHTACTLDLEEGTCAVRARGGVTILRGSETLRHEAGTVFPLSDLAGAEAVGAQPAVPLRDVSEGTSLPQSLAQASARIAAGDLADGLRRAATDAEPALAAVLVQAARCAEGRPPSDERLGPLIGLLLEARNGLRACQQWALADELRHRLLALGIEVRDTPQGTVWEEAPPR